MGIILGASTVAGISVEVWTVSDREEFEQPPQTVPSRYQRDCGTE